MSKIIRNNDTVYSMRELAQQRKEVEARYKRERDGAVDAIINYLTSNPNEGMTASELSTETGLDVRAITAALYNHNSVISHTKRPVRRTFALVTADGSVDMSQTITFTRAVNEYHGNPRRR